MATVEKEYIVNDWGSSTVVSKEEFYKLIPLLGIHDYCDTVGKVIALRFDAYAELKEKRALKLTNDHLFGAIPMDPMKIAGIDTTGSLEPAANKNPLVIYHANCADGFSAAWCFYNYNNMFPTNYPCRFHAGVYSEPPPEDIAGRHVYLVDFSYKRAVVEEMLKAGAIIWLVDHHVSAIKDLAGLEKEYATFRTYTDVDRSGAMLAWDFLNNVELDDAEEISYSYKPGEVLYTAPPLLLNHIQDRDLWKFKLSNTREISASVFSYKYTFENWDKLMSSDSVELLELTASGAAIERKHHKDVAELVKVCMRIGKIGDHLVPIASLPYTLSSDAGHLMTSEYEEGQFFAACYWDTATHRVFSLRSTEQGLDVSLIAKEYGGGGHRNAAGFSVLRSHPLATF